MEIIVLPRLTLHELQTITADTLSIVKDSAPLKTAIAKVKKAYDPFIDGMRKEQLTATTKKEQDEIRDRLLNGFIKCVRAEACFPHTDTKALEAQKSLQRIVDKFGLEIVRLPNNTETSAIDNMLSEIETIDLSPLNDSGLVRWLTHIKGANNEFKKASLEYNSESTENKQLLSASTIAPELRNALNALYALLFGLLLVEPTDELKSIQMQISTLVTNY